MVLTEHHLNCVRNLVRSAAARLGGGVHQDKPTQKNKQMWTCLAILMAGCEIHTQEDMKQQDAGASAEDQEKNRSQGCPRVLSRF